MSVNRLSLAVVLLVSFSTVRVGAETIYFKNRRTIDAQSYEIKKSLVYITMAGGKVVYVRGDSIDWEGTERLKSTDVVLQKDAYEAEAAEEGEEAAEEVAGSGGPALSAEDLRRGGNGQKKRKRTPQLVVEIRANEGCWVDSRVNVREGQLIILRASGEVSLGDGGSSKPTGLGTPAGGEVAPDLPLGALIARVGLAGQAFMVGQGIKFKPRTAGRLFLCVNDTTPQDDTGAYSVKVSQPTPSSNMSALPGGSGGAGVAAAGSSAPPGAGGGAPPPSRPVTSHGAVDRARTAAGR